MTDDGRALALGAAGLLALAATVRPRGSRSRPIPIHNVYDVMGQVGMPFVDIVEASLAHGGSWKQVIQLFPPQMRQDPRLRIVPILYAYAAQGQQTFVVGPRLARMFEETSLDRVPPEFIRLPYPGYYLALPNSGLRLYHFADNAWRDVVGAFVVDLQPLGLEPGIGISIWAAPAHPVRTIDDIVHYEDAWLFLDPMEATADPQGMESWVDQMLWMGTEDRKRFNNPSFTAAYAEVSRTYRDMLRIVINSMLYINSGGADLSVDPHSAEVLRRRQQLTDERNRVLAGRERERSKRRQLDKIDEKLSKLSGGTVTWLGRHIEEATGTRAAGYTMRGHWRRGHWKLPFRKSGPRVLTWVQPYPVGSERDPGAPKVTKRTYHHVEDSDGQE